jgi:carboxypeptidase C (cathepsin A)
MQIRRAIAPILALSILVPAFAPGALAAQDATAPDAAKSDAQKKEEGPAPKALKFETQHKLEAGGRSLAYTAVAETTMLDDAKGKPEAEFFSVSYLAKDGSADRPITFAFNGGPGSSSVWLHMGLLGPKRVQVPSDAQAAGAPPFPVADNPDSLLLASDLVFVDPIGTGLSRVVNAGKNADHWGVDEDARSVARFIRRYLSTHDRWASPKYVLGESYGGIRGPLLVRELQGGMNSVALNGLVLISPALDMALVDGQENDAALATVLPTYAATAWYHKALGANPPQNLDAFLAEVCAWVTDEYIPALFKGRDLPDDRRAAIVAKLSKYTGISPEYIQRANLRITTDRFRRELLRDRGLVVGRLDTRYTGTEPDSVGEMPSGDPMSAGISGAYVATFMSYLRKDLGVDVDREYVVMSEEAGKNWKRPKEDGAAFQGYVDVSPALARGMADNPALRVFVASGLYDIATTFFAEEYVVRRSTMDRSRVTLKRYPAGHMMYVNGPSFADLTKNIREFVARPVKKDGAVAGN